MSKRLLVLLVLCSCGEDPAVSPTTDVASDADSTIDAVDASEDEDVVMANGCEALFDPGFTFELDRNGEPTQIHADSVFDGENIVTAYVSRSTTGENFDLWLSVASCGATTTRAPLLVVDSAHGNVTEPQLALGTDGNLLLVWQLDDGSGADNLSLWSRRYDAALEPLNDAHRLELRRDGTANLGNTWMPALEPTASGFALAGAWAHEDAERFQVFAQELDASGEPVGDAIDLELEPTVTQVFPALAVGLNDVGVAWERTPDEGEVEVRGARVSLSDRSVSELTTFAEGGGVAVAHLDGEYVWAASVSNQIALWRGEHETLLGSTGVDVAPALVPHLENGVLGVIWYRIQSGIRNDIFRHELPTDSEWADAVGTLVPLDGPAAPYSPVMIEVGPGWFLAWSSGQSPDFHVLGRFEE